MSGDVAVLGLSIDSRQVVTAKQALDGLTASAKPAAAAAASLEKAGKSAANGAQALANSTGLARHELINLSRQIQDVGVSLASGQSPFMVLAQQGTQIADIFGSSKTATVGGALKQIVTGIGAARLATLGFVGVLAGTAFAVKSMGDGAKAFDDLARSVDASRDKLGLLQQAASFKGIGSEDFAKFTERFGAAVYDAKNNMGGLAEVMRANSKSASDFSGYLENAADLIKNASSDQARLQLLQQMGLPATMQWVKFLSQGKDGIRAATEEAVRFNESAEGKLIASARAFDDAWNKATTKMVAYFKAGILDIVGSLSSVQVPQWLLNAGRGAAGGILGGPVGMVQGAILGGLRGNEASFGDRFGSFGSVGNAAGLQQGLQNRVRTLNGESPTVNKDALLRSISLRQQELGLYGQTITAAEAVEQVEKQAAAARLNLVNIDEKRVEVLKKLTAEQTIGVTAIKASTDAANIDAAAVGMGAGAAAEYAAKQNALNDARRAGRELTADNIAQIQREAAALGQAAQRADNLRFAFSGLVQGPLQTFTSAIQNGSSAWDAFKNSGISALTSLANKLAEMAAQNLWAAAFGGGGGGGFNLGSLFGGGGASAGAITLGGPGGPVPFFANGTDFAPGGWAVVGEKGPELMNVPRGAQILPNGVSPSGGGAPQPVHVTVGVSVDNDGNLQAYVKDVAQNTASKSIGDFVQSSAFVDHVGGASRQANVRRLGR